MRFACCVRLVLPLALAPVLLGGLFARGDDESPEALLKAKGLTRTKAVFFNKEKEAPVLEALQGLKPLAEAMDETGGELSTAMANEERFRTANEMEASLTAQINQIDIQLSAVPKNRLNQAMRSELQSNQRALKLQQAEAVAEIKSTAPLRVPPRRLDFLKTKYQEANNKYYEAVTPVNSSLKEISSLYAKLAADSAVKAALGAYGRANKIVAKVSRSEELQDAIAWKGRVEKAHRPYKIQTGAQPRQATPKPGRRR
jgi:hypothetical protein